MKIWSQGSFIALLVVTVGSVGVVAMAHDPAQHGAAMHAHVVTVPAEAPYLAENDVAMNKMMADMAAEPTGDIDCDFVAMMVPHHNGAIDMALAYLKYGSNERLKRIAQEIIVDQQQEIAAMKLAIGDPLPPSNAAPTQVAPQNSSDSSMPGMDPDMKM